MGLENKIWREIEITDRRTVADLAYAILASFESLAYHLFNIKYKNRVYECGVATDCIFDEIPFFADKTSLKALELKSNDTLVMEYDYGLSFIFKITYLESMDFRRGSGNGYPKVVAGAGRGMIDDVTNGELREIVADIDKKGKSKYKVISLETNKYVTYDYRNFSLSLNNLLERDRFRRIKVGYENEE